MAEARIGPYEIVRPIGAGGMATVVLARVTAPDGTVREVAIKRMHPELSEDPQFRAMFLDEARLAACVRHPHVVATLDVQSDAEGAFMVLEYVDGVSLLELAQALWRDEGALLPLPVTLSVMLDLLAGLHAAHEQRGPDGAPLGIVHRDVCPQNVLVGRDGLARISDFGIARAEKRLAATPYGKVKGKLGYLEPERLRGGPGDRRADVYSAGVVLWELLTGRTLFEGDLVTMSQAILRGSVRPPRQLNGAVPSALDETCMAALRPRADRYASAADFARSLADAAVRTGIVPAARAVVGRLVLEAQLARTPTH
jgi:serine/threonine-protein kinase